MQFSLVTGLHLFFLSFGNNVVKQILRHDIARQEIFESLILPLQFLAVAIHIFQVGVDDDTFCCQLAVELGELCRIERYKDIGHDAATAIDGAMQKQGLIFQ